MAPLIEIKNLTKDYHLTEKREGVSGGLIDLFRPRKKTLRAVSDVSFSIDRGEMVGYIGANGAGKSTTIKMLSGILTPTSGTADVGGLVPWLDRQKYTRHIGAVFGQRTQLWWDLAVVESFRLLQKIYEVEESVYRQQMELFQEILSIGEYLHQPVRKLSLGQRMRCDLAAALLHKPSILFLDEPTIGLDVVAKENIRKFLKGIQQEQGVTVILTTHDLGDIEHLCKRVIIIDKGLVHFDGEVDTLRRNAGAKVQLQVDLREATSSTVLDAEFTDLPVTWNKAEGKRHVAKFQRTDISSADVIRRLVNAFPVSDLHLAEPPIEEIVSRIYRDGGHTSS